MSFLKIDLILGHNLGSLYFSPINEAASFLYSIADLDFGLCSVTGVVFAIDSGILISSGNTLITGTSAASSISFMLNSNFLFMTLFKIRPLIGVFFCLDNFTARNVALKVG